jgi:hypothetical protein
MLTKPFGVGHCCSVNGCSVNGCAFSGRAVNSGTAELRDCIIRSGSKIGIINHIFRRTVMYGDC